MNRNIGGGSKKTPLVRIRVKKLLRSFLCGWSKCIARKHYKDTCYIWIVCFVPRHKNRPVIICLDAFYCSNNGFTPIASVSRCYKMVLEKVTWSTAVSRCSAMNSHLAVIYSAQEHTAITNIIAPMKGIFHSLHGIVECYKW